MQEKGNSLRKQKLYYANAGYGYIIIQKYNSNPGEEKKN